MSIPEHECLAIISQAEARSELQRIGVEIGIDDDRSASQFVVEALMYVNQTGLLQRRDEPEPSKTSYVDTQRYQEHKELVSARNQSAQSPHPYFA